MASVVPQQVIHPRSRLTVHVEIGSAEEIRLDDHVIEMKRPLLNATTDLSMRAGEPARVGDHADFASLLRRLQHALRIGQVQAHRNFNLDVLAFRQRENGLICVQGARCRQDDRVDAGRSMQVSRLLEQNGIFHFVAKAFEPSSVRPETTRSRHRRFSTAPSRGFRPSRRSPPDRFSCRLFYDLCGLTLVTSASALQPFLPLQPFRPTPQPASSEWSPPSS